MRRTITALLVALLTSMLLLELGTLAAVRIGLLATPRPTGGEGYWRGDHPEFGVWHHPDARFSHRNRCFDANYRTSSVGTRDVERALRSDRPRVVVLGDSFFEGWGLPEHERLSNLLEGRSGIEHMNFAMAHFGPYQSYLAYRSLARHYDHDTVLLSVLPANDFIDSDLELARRLGGYRFRYRPYLWGEPPDLRHLDYRENPVRRTLRHHSYLFNALLAASEAASAGSGPLLSPVDEEVPDELASWFYDFQERDLLRLEAILAKLAREARGKRVVVVLVPTYPDLGRHRLSGEDPLGARLRRAGNRDGFEVVDLLAPMAAHESRLQSHFLLPCDYHWSSLGNSVAAEILWETLQQDGP